MAKSLGQIHTTNFILDANDVADTYLLDLPGQLCDQLQTMVRQGQYFKVVGIDMNVTDISGAQSEGFVSGRLKYYAPTRGRCEAYKQAFRAVQRGMKLQGVNIRGNRNYDFRVAPEPLSNYTNGSSFVNVATVNGVDALVLTGAGGSDIECFGNYNANIQPSQSGAPTFNPGFGLPGIGSGTDFVLNEGQLFDPTMVRSADTAYESIPFQVSFSDSTAGTATAAFQMEWRPDPALYLAVMLGMFVVEYDSIEGSPNSNLELEIAIHVSGWKSIMGNPDKKRRRSKRRSKKKMNKPRNAKFVSNLMRKYY